MFPFPPSTILIALGLLLLCLALFMGLSWGAGRVRVMTVASVGAAVFIVGLLLHLSQPPAAGRGSESIPAARAAGKS